MPSGIVLSSGSIGVTKEDLEKVLENHGLPVEKPEAVEPVRDSFASDEEFTAAHAEWKTKQAPPAKTGEEADEDEDEEVKEFLAETEPKRKSKFQKRIDKITAPLKREIEELRAKVGKGAEPEKKEEEAPRPKRTDFDTDDKYEDALLAWGNAKHEKEKAAKDAKTAETELLQGFLENYNQDKQEFAETHEDFEEVVGASKVVLHQAVQMAIYEEEKPARIVYYLATHPDHAEKLAAMTPLSAVMEVGRLSQKLAAASGSPGSGTGGGEPPKPKPKLPAPIQRGNTSATASTLTSRDAAGKGDFAGFKAARRAGR